MQITVINKSNTPDADVLRAIRAINRQIKEDFKPYWHKSATMTLHGSERTTGQLNPKDLRGDAVIYLSNFDNTVDALGYHAITSSGVPYSVVYTDLMPNEPWSVTLSHEALEMLLDPTTVLFAQGRHPKENRMIYYWYEACDAVQTEVYMIDEVEVSNFVLPLYFTPSEEPGQVTNFLMTDLKSLGLRPGGYFGFFDPKLGKHDTMFSDELAKWRVSIKNKSKYRRGNRYQG